MSARHDGDRGLRPDPGPAQAGRTRPGPQVGEEPDGEHAGRAPRMRRRRPAEGFLDLLCEHAPPAGPSEPREDAPSPLGAPLEPLPEVPYDPALFADADDEGIGGMRPQRT
ncbi:hypothetical protein ACU686_32280 [Yinghuangia aomiensis]